MTNHLHLVIQVGEIPLSRIMQNLPLRHTKWINWSQNRIGHLFHGRYKAVMVEADNYLAQLVAYLHLNPVRAGICENLIDYPWSSYRGAYLGLEQASWLATEAARSQFSPRLKRARELFREFVEASALAGHRPEFHGKNAADGRVLGNDTFVDEVLRNECTKPVAVTIDNALAAVCEVCGLTMEEIRSPSKGLRVSEGRALAAWLVLNLCDGTLTELGRNVGQDFSTLSSAVKRLVLRSKKDGEIAARMNSVRETAIVFTRLQS